VRSSAERWRGRLFQKYVGAIVLLVSGVLLASGLVQVYFAYGENESVQLRLQEEKAAAAAATLQPASVARANVHPAIELSALMDTQRQLEANANMIRYQDQTLQRLVNDVGKIS